LFTILLLAAGSYLLARTVALHFSDKITLNYSSKQQTVRRGYINGSNGELLAVSIEQSSLFANPRHITQPRKTAQLLSEILQMDEDEIYTRLILNRQFIWIKRKLPDLTVSKIRSLKIDGLYFKKEFKRVYPHDTLASHILGFTDIDNNGLAGIEYKYDSYLKGEEDVKNVDSDNLVFGYNVKLTIDKYIQYVAEKYLFEAAEKHSADKGAVIVQDVTNGRILAAAVYPAYNPNYYYRYSPNERALYSIVEPFEPGSTMKIFAAAAWLRSSAKDFNRTYNGNGEITLYDTTIHSTKVHGWITLPDAIRVSCNVSVIRAMMDVPQSTLYETLERYGFGKRSCPDFPGEAAGILREVKQWSGLSKYSISIGHELSVNSLQLTAAYSAIANGGIYIEPSIIESIEMNDGHKIQEFYPRSRGQIISRENSEHLRKMLRSVVVSGTGSNAETVYYKTAGKTGTAQKASPTGGYDEERYTASFVGFAPFEKPKISISFIIDEPQGVTSGGDVAAPYFAAIVRDVLPYLGVGASFSDSETIKTASGSGLEFDGKTMPNVIGKQPADIAPLLTSIQNSINAQVNITGDGWIATQNPSPGTILKPGAIITLTLINVEEPNAR
jgi:cell division protein FtsI (penicillin-binding protein 3)